MRIIKEKSVLVEGLDVKPSPIDTSSLKVKDRLNPSVWIGSDKKLHPAVRRGLLKIARDFVDSLDLSSVVEDCNPRSLIPDVVLLGSLASYNWSRYSDFDLHVLFDYSLLGLDDKNRELLKQYFAKAKNEWNLKHSDLNILGYDVELYVQGVDEKNAANGCYSLLKDMWIKFPEKMFNSYDEGLVEKKARWFSSRINLLADALESGDCDFGRIHGIARLLKDKITRLRKDSLNAEGDEMSEGNLVFKALRRSRHMELLNEILNLSYDKENSIQDAAGRADEGARDMKGVYANCVMLERALLNDEPLEEASDAETQKVRRMIDSDKYWIKNDYQGFVKSMFSNDNPYSAFLSKYTPEELREKHARTFKLKGYNIGFALIPADGGHVDIASVHNNSDVRGVVQNLLKSALRHGGDQLDHFEGKLSDFYSMANFKEYQRYKFNPEYAPDDWNYDRDGTPDVVLRRYVGGSEN